MRGISAQLARTTATRALRSPVATTNLALTTASTSRTSVACSSGHVCVRVRPSARAHMMLSALKTSVSRALYEGFEVVASNVVVSVSAMARNMSAAFSAPASTTASAATTVVTAAATQTISHAAHRLFEKPL